MTLQRDGEEAVEVSPKRFAKQWAATYGDEKILSGGPSFPVKYQYSTGPGTVETYQGTLREETYKKSKKTGTEKLRCKLDGLDAELVDDLVGLPGPVPCMLEFRTPCDDDELD